MGEQNEESTLPDSNLSARSRNGGSAEQQFKHKRSEPERHHAQRFELAELDQQHRRGH
jgi:hypothetical protein